MSPREQYETAKNGEDERRVASFVADAWQCSPVKLPIGYKLDYALTLEGGRVIGWLEAKRRNVVEAQYKSIYLAQYKVLAARGLYESTTLPAYFAVQFDDGLRYVDILARSWPVEMSRPRKDRNDSADIEPCAMIPTARFAPIDGIPDELQAARMLCR